MFEPKKYSEILKDLKNRSDILTDFEPGSVARTLYESFSYEMALLYEKMNFVYLSAYIDTAEGVQLERIVAVLGIKRGIPDFAQGEVLLTKDMGTVDIEIPAGTFVSTEDTQESPRKVYEIIEQKKFNMDDTEILVKIQALKRGEEEVTDAETITVMSRPIPRIKSVINPQAVVFTGKKLETDDELRERTKNSIISSGRATIFSIENAVMSLPGVRDVKVKENFNINKGKFGIIEVFADSADLSHKEKERVENEEKRIMAEIERVKAAGIYVKLQKATNVYLIVEIKVETTEDLTSGSDELAGIHGSAEEEIIKYIEDLKMGETFIYSQVIWRILSIDGIEDIEISKITAKKNKISSDYDSSSKRIEAEEFERFIPEKIIIK